VGKDQCCGKTERSINVRRGNGAVINSAGQRKINRHEATILDTNHILKPLTNDKKFVAFFDILGFSNIVRKRDIKILSTIITEVLLPGIEDSVQGVYIPDKVKISNVSDSIILYTIDDSVNSCLLLLIACNKLMSTCFKIQFPLRGAVAYGEFIADDKHFVGKALVDAVDYEKKQQWSGCLVTPDCAETIKNSYYVSRNPLDMQTIDYQVPLKCGERVKYYYALRMWVDLIGDTNIDVKKYFPVSDNLGENELSKQQNTQEFINFVKGFGESSYYRRRNPEDSRLDPEQ
jgi:hypothetical protein